MITTFHLPADQLDMAILKSIKEAFKGKDIEIIISDANEQTTNISSLLTRIEHLKKDKNTVTFEQDDFFRSYKKKIADATN